MTALRPDLPPLPDRMKALPVDARGYCVPWFVATIDGVPDFRVIRPNGFATAIKQNRCWLCGQTLGVFKAFVIGPMCAINRVTSEPPSHRECAEFAVKACPFLTRPMAARSSRPLPEEAQPPAGVHLDRNAGAACLWVAKDYTPFKVGYRAGSAAGWLIELGEPHSVSWWAQGRPATRGEVETSISGGFPALKAAAEQEGPEAELELLKQMGRALPLLPQEIA